METFTYDELQLIRDTLNESKFNHETELDEQIVNPLMDKLDRMIQSKELVEKTLLPWEPR